MKILRTLTLAVLASAALVSALVAPSSFAEERLKPFVLASTSTDSLDSVAAAARDRLVDAGYRIVGDYAPYENAEVFVFTSDVLTDIAAKTELGAFGAVLRAAVTVVNGEAQLSYVNPLYLAQAYRLDNDLADVAGQLAEVLGAEKTFGSDKGLKPKSVRKYHYMIGMEYFDDTYKLGKYDSHQAAVAAVDAGLTAGKNGLSEVYRLELPGSEAVLYGVAMAPESEDDKAFSDAYQMSIVDFSDTRSTAYLPYEVLVKGGEVKALHMRFRMAVHFPDLSMMGKHSFMTLSSSPDAIEDALESLLAE